MRKSNTLLPMTMIPKDHPQVFQSSKLLSDRQLDKVGLSHCQAVAPANLAKADLRFHRRVVDHESF